MPQTKITTLSDEPSLLMRIFIRFISPRFNDEITQWFSSVPFISAIVQIILSMIAVLFGILKMLGMMSESDTVQRGGCAAGLFVLFQFAFAILLFIAFMSGLFTSLAMIALVIEMSPYVMPLFLGLYLVGTLLKNKLKVQAMGHYYEFKTLYYVAIALAAILSVSGIMSILNAGDENVLKQTGLGELDTIFIPVVALSSIIVIFHGFIKPLLTNLLIIYVAFFVKTDAETALRIQTKKDNIAHSMGKARTVLAGVRYLVIAAGLLFFIALTFSVPLGLDDILLTDIDAPIPLSLAYQGVFPIVISFWVALLLWFGVMSTLSPQKSIIAKLMRLFKRNTANVSTIISGIGIITLLATLYAVNHDLHVFPNDQQAREANSVIYKTVQQMEWLQKRNYSPEKMRKNPKPQWVNEVALSLYQQHQKAGTIDLLNIDEDRDYRRNQYNNKTHFYTEQIAHKAIPRAISNVMEMCFIVIGCIGVAIFLGAFTKDKQHLSAYAVSALLIPFVFMYMITASDRLIVETKENVIEIAGKFSQ